MNMKNVPRKLDSKTTCLSIRVPENLDLALEGLIRKVLREQPKTDDLYEFAADYFESLLRIRDHAGIKKTADEICPDHVHNNEDAHEMVKLANTFLKPSPDERSTSPSRPGRWPTTNALHGHEDENKENEDESNARKGVASVENMGGHAVNLSRRKGVVGDVKNGKSSRRREKISRETGVALRDETNLQMVVSKTATFAGKMQKTKQKKISRRVNVVDDEKRQEKDLVKEMVEREINEKGKEKKVSEVAERNKASDDSVTGTDISSPSEKSREKKTESKNESHDDENDQREKVEASDSKSDVRASESGAENDATDGSKKDQDGERGSKPEEIGEPEQREDEQEGTVKELGVQEEDEERGEKHFAGEKGESSGGEANRLKVDVADIEMGNITTVDESETTEGRDDDTLADAKDLDSKTEEERPEDKSDAAEDPMNLDSDNSQRLVRKTTEEEEMMETEDVEYSAHSVIDEKGNEEEEGTRTGEVDVKEGEEKKKAPAVPGIPADGKLGGGKVRRSFQEARNAAKKTERFGRKTTRKGKSEEKLDGILTPGDVLNKKSMKESESSGKERNKDKFEPGHRGADGRRDQGTDRESNRRRRGGADKKPEDPAEGKPSERFKKRTPFDQSKAKVDSKEKPIRSRSKKMVDSGGDAVPGAAVPAVFDVAKGERAKRDSTREKESSASSSKDGANDNDVELGGGGGDAVKAIGGLPHIPQENQGIAQSEYDLHAMRRQTESAAEPEAEDEKLQTDNAAFLRRDGESEEEQNRAMAGREPTTEEKTDACITERKCEGATITENVDCTETLEPESREKDEVSEQKENLNDENLEATSEDETKDEDPAEKTQANSDQGSDARAAANGDAAKDEISENRVDGEESEAPTAKSSPIEMSGAPKDDDATANSTSAKTENVDVQANEKDKIEADANISKEEGEEEKKETGDDVIEIFNQSEQTGDLVEAVDKLEEYPDSLGAPEEVRGKGKDFIVTDETSPKEDLIVDDEMHKPEIREEIKTKRKLNEGSETVEETHEDEEDVVRVGGEDGTTKKSEGDDESCEKKAGSALENGSNAGTAAEIGSEDECGGKEDEVVNKVVVTIPSEQESPAATAVAIVTCGGKDSDNEGEPEEEGEAREAKIPEVLKKEENEENEENEEDPGRQGNAVEVDEPDCVKVSVKPVGTALIDDSPVVRENGELSDKTEATNRPDSSEPEQGKNEEGEGRAEEENKEEIREVDASTEMSEEGNATEAHGRDSHEATANSEGRDEKTEENTLLMQSVSPVGKPSADPTQNLTVTAEAIENTEVAATEFESMAITEITKAIKDGLRESSPTDETAVEITKTEERDAGIPEAKVEQAAYQVAENATIEETSLKTEDQMRVNVKEEAGYGISNEVKDDDEKVSTSDTTETAVVDAQDEIGNAGETTGPVERTNIETLTRDDEATVTCSGNETTRMETTTATTTTVGDEPTEDENVSVDRSDASLKDLGEVDPEAGEEIVNEIPKVGEDVEGGLLPEKGGKETLCRMLIQTNRDLEKSTENEENATNSAPVPDKFEESKKARRNEAEEESAKTDRNALGENEKAAEDVETYPEKAVDEPIKSDGTEQIGNDLEKNEEVEEGGDESGTMAKPSKEETMDDLRPGGELTEAGIEKTVADSIRAGVNDSSDPNVAAKRDSEEEETPKVKNEGNDALGSTPEEIRDGLVKDIDTPVKDTGQEKTSGGTARGLDDDGQIMVTERGEETLEKIEPKTKDVAKEVETQALENEEIRPAAMATDPNRTTSSNLDVELDEVSGNGRPVLGDVFTNLKTPSPGKGHRVFNQVKDEVETLRKDSGDPTQSSDTGSGSVTGEPREADESNGVSSEGPAAQNAVSHSTGGEVNEQANNEATSGNEGDVEVSVKNAAARESHEAGEKGDATTEESDLRELADHVWKPKSIKEDSEDFIYVEEASSEPDKIHHQEFLDELVIGGKFPKTPSQEREDETETETAMETAMETASENSGAPELVRADQPDITPQESGKKIEENKPSVIHVVEATTAESDGESDGVDVTRPATSAANVSEHLSGKPFAGKIAIANEGAKVFETVAVADGKKVEVGAENLERTEKTGDDVAGNAEESDDADAATSEWEQEGEMAEAGRTDGASQLETGNEAPAKDEETRQVDVTETAGQTEEEQRAEDEPSGQESNETDVVVTADVPGKAEGETPEVRDGAVVEECSVANAETSGVDDESDRRVPGKGSELEKSLVERLPQWVPINGGIIPKSKEKNEKPDEGLERLHVRESSQRNPGDVGNKEEMFDEIQEKEVEGRESKFDEETELGAETVDEVKPPDIEVTENVDREFPEKDEGRTVFDVQGDLGGEAKTEEDAMGNNEDEVDGEDAGAGAGDSQSSQGKKIKKIIPHYFDLLVVPEIVTKKYQVHFMKENSPVTSSISESGTVIRAYQFDKDDTEAWTVVKEVVSHPGTEPQESRKSEFDDHATPSPGYSILVSDMSRLVTVSEAFLSAERRYSSMELEERERSDRNISDVENDFNRERIHQVEVEPPSEVGEPLKETATIKTVRAFAISPRNKIQEGCKQTEEEMTGEKLKNDESPPEAINGGDGSKEGVSFDEYAGFHSVEIETVIQNEVLDDVDDDDDDGDVVNHMASRVVTESPFGGEWNGECLVMNGESEKGEQEFDAGEQDVDDTSGMQRKRSSDDAESTVTSVATKVKKIESKTQGLMSSSEETVISAESKRSLFTQGSRGSDTEVWSFLEREISAAATKIQTTFRGFRNRLQRDNAIQISTEESSSGTASAEQGLQGTGEFHDTIVPPSHHQ